MKSLHTVRTAVRSLRRNILRAILTTLGVIIGVASVITMIELGNGFTDSFMKAVGAKAANTIMIYPGAMERGGVNSGSGGRRSLTVADAERIAAECPAVEFVSPVVNGAARLVYGNRNWTPGAVYGTTPSYFEQQNMEILPGGRAFSDADVKSQALVCVVGSRVVKELFAGRSPVGAEMRMNGVPVRIIGALKEKGREGWFSNDDCVVVPWSSLTHRLSDATPVSAAFSAASAASAAKSSSSSGASGVSDSSAYATAESPVPVRFGNIDMLLATTRTTAEVDEAGDRIAAVLRSSHHLAKGTADDFTVEKLSGMIDRMMSGMGMISTFLLCIGLIALLVGGVGIMNIMLVSVTERTREIGLRMAVGAESRDILLQFLTEAIVLCAAGGALGILLGRGCSMLISNTLGWHTVPSAGAIVSSFLVAGAVGVVFGFYPAWKASKLDPIEALRHE